MNWLKLNRSILNILVLFTTSNSLHVSAQTPSEFTANGVWYHVESKYTPSCYSINFGASINEKINFQGIKNNQINDPEKPEPSPPISKSKPLNEDSEICKSQFWSIGNLYIEKMNQQVLPKAIRADFWKKTISNQFGTECRDENQLTQIKNEPYFLERGSGYNCGVTKLLLKNNTILKGTDLPLVKEGSDTLILEGYILFNSDSVKHSICITLLSSDDSYVQIKNISNQSCKSSDQQISPEQVKSLLISYEDLEEGYPDLKRFKNLRSLKMSLLINTPLPDYVYQLRSLDLECTQCKVQSKIGDTIVYHVPQKLLQSPYLKSLHLNSSKLDFGGSFPVESNLEHLSIHTSGYLSLASIFNLNKLKSLDLYIPSIRQFPDSLSKLSHLEYLSILFSGYTTAIPKEFGPWPNLKQIDVIGGGGWSQTNIDLLIQQHPSAIIYFKTRRIH